MLPCHSPMFLRMSRLHDELPAGEREGARQIFADQSPHQRALDVIVKRMSTFVDLIGAERRLITTLSVLHGRRTMRLLGGLGIAIHHLHRHVPIARVYEQASTVCPVNFSVRALLFEPGQSPRSDKAVPAVSSSPIPAGLADCDQGNPQAHHAERKLFFHRVLPTARCWFTQL